MSESIIPWIAPYLVGVAEEHGANVSGIPKFTKRKKVQLVEFLTRHENDVLWARISDKEYMLPVRFSKHAVDEYNRSHPTRITKYKTSMIHIKDFRPIYTRIPLGNDKLTTEKYLALECDAFGSIGAAGEPRFGNPKPIEKHSDLLEWSEGLKHDGGAGNCLKNRKRAQGHPIQPPEPVQVLAAIEEPATSPVNKSNGTSNKTQPVAPKIQKRKTQIFFTSAESKEQGHKMKWISGQLLRPPPPDVAATLTALRAEKQKSAPATPEDAKPVLEPAHKRRKVTALMSSPPKSPLRARSRSATPLSDKEWPASQPAPSVHVEPGVEDPQNEVEEENQETSQTAEPTTSSVVPPTPAQRPRPVLSQLPPSSPPPPDSQMSIVEETILSTRSPPSEKRGRRAQALRKVPRPRLPPAVTRFTEEPIILAPNSDTSYSQSQTQSQSQSLSQPFVQSTQDVVLSQLPTLARSPLRSEHIHSDQIDDDKERELSCEALDTNDEADDNLPEYNPNDPVSVNPAVDQGDGDNDKATSSRPATPGQVISERFAGSIERTSDDDGLLPPTKNASTDDDKVHEDPHLVGEHGSGIDSLAPKGNSPRGPDGKLVDSKDGEGKTSHPTIQAGQTSRRGSPPVPALPKEVQASSLSNDDAQIRHDLGNERGAAIPDNQPSSSQWPSRRGNISLKDQTSSRGAGPQITSSVAGTNEPAPHVVREVEHDAQAWKEPSFMKSRLRPVDVRAKSETRPLQRPESVNPHAPSRPPKEAIKRPSAEAGLQALGRQMQLQARRGAIMRSRPVRSPSDENLDPASKQSTSSNQLASSKSAPPAPSTDKSFGKKRGQSLTLEDSNSENAGPSSKRRRVARSSGGRDQGAKTIPKLGGFTYTKYVRTDSEEAGKGGWVSWETLLDIWKRNILHE